MNEQIFYVTPPTQNAVCWTIVIAIICITIMLLLTLVLIFIFGRTFVSLKGIKAEINGKGIKINGMYGRFIPKENLKISDSKIVNLKDSKYQQFTPSFRLNGTALPGLYLGWYRIKSKQKALVFVTDMTNVLIIPTDKYLLYLSTNEGEKILNSLK